MTGISEYVNAPGVFHYDTGRTALTQITNDDNTACVVSHGLVCDFPEENIPLRLETDMNVCNNHRAALFYYDVDLGYLIHHCSGRPVGPSGISDTSHMMISQTTAPYIANIHSYFTAIRRDFSKF